jgi:hypothetical protein
LHTKCIYKSIFNVHAKITELFFLYYPPDMDREGSRYPATLILTSATFHKIIIITTSAKTNRLKNAEFFCVSKKLGIHLCNTRLKLYSLYL